MAVAAPRPDRPLGESPGLRHRHGQSGLGRPPHPPARAGPSATSTSAPGSPTARTVPLPESVLGRDFQGFPDERWLDIRRLDVLTPTWRSASTSAGEGLRRRRARQRRRLHQPTPASRSPRPTSSATTAGSPTRPHERGMSVGLKNDLGQVPTLRPYFDFAVNEQCFQYHECGRLRPFIRGTRRSSGPSTSSPPRFCAKSTLRLLDDPQALQPQGVAADVPPRASTAGAAHEPPDLRRLRDPHQRDCPEVDHGAGREARGRARSVWATNDRPRAWSSTYHTP